MGYYTVYSLSIQALDTAQVTKAQKILEIQKSNLNQTLKEHLVSLIDEKYTPEQITEQTVVNELGGYDPFEQRCKWYEYHEDMIRISKKYPQVVFTLDGDGEESGDVWRKYYCNGKFQDARAKIVYESFDLDKLTDT